MKPNLIQTDNEKLHIKQDKCNKFIYTQILIPAYYLTGETMNNNYYLYSYFDCYPKVTKKNQLVHLLKKHWII